jgi:hypothetical protein
MSSKYPWNAFYEQLFRMKVKRKELEQYVAKVDRIAEMNISSLHPETLQNFSVLKHKYIPLIQSCEVWLENYLGRQRSTFGDKVQSNDYAVETMKTWVNDYVAACLNNPNYILHDMKFRHE